MYLGRPRRINYAGAFFAVAGGFVRSGNVNMGNGFLRNAGINGNYWSRSGVASTTAYNLNFNASGVNPSNGPNNRYNGFSLRS